MVDGNVNDDEDLDGEADSVELSVDVDKQDLEAAIESDEEFQVALDTPEEFDIEMANQITINGDVLIKQIAGTPEFDETLSVAEQTTDTIVSYSVGSDEAITGYRATGESDGSYELQLNSQRQDTDIGTRGSPLAGGKLPTPLDVSDGDTVEVKVTNVGVGASDYEAAIYVEER
jgi:hypothetical protein